VDVRRPRVRNTEERFGSRVLPLFVRRTSKVRDLIPTLYLHGLAEGDFDLALRGLLGDQAPVSASTVARLKERWHVEYQMWRRRSLEELEVVYLWVDGVYVKAGLEREKAAVLVALAGLTDGRKVVVAIEPGYRESTESWSVLLRDLKARGMGCPCLVIGDGHRSTEAHERLGIWGALRNVFPEADEQRCWNHKVLNVMSRLPKRAHAQARSLLCSIPYGATREEAEDRRDALRRVVPGERVSDGGGDPGAGLGPDGGLLRLSGGPLVTHQDHQPAGVTLRCPPAEDRCGQAVQAGGQGNGADLEAADGSRETVSQAQRGNCSQGSIRNAFSPKQSRSSRHWRRWPPDPIYTLIDVTSSG